MRRVIRTRGRRRSTCHHEAGHALARWWLGFDTDSAAVLSGEEVKAGVGLVDHRGTMRYDLEGMVCGHGIHLPFARQIVDSDTDAAARAMIAKTAPIRTEMALVMIYAGAFAQAAFAKRSGTGSFFAGSLADLDDAKTIAAEWFIEEADQDRVHRQGERLAKALVRSPKGSVAIWAIAEVLYECGDLTGAEIDALCSVVYGELYAYDRWAEAWPPTPAQIRSGFLPRSRLKLLASDVTTTPEND